MPRKKKDSTKSDTREVETLPESSSFKEITEKRLKKNEELLRRLAD